MRHLTQIAAVAFAAAFVFASAADAASCKDPKTHKFVKCPPPAVATNSSPAPAAAAAAAGAPKCKVGKPCGKTCIAKNKVCTIK